MFLCGASFLVLYAMGLSSTEYIYPLIKGSHNGQDTIIFMHQTPAQETRLWSLNMETNHYEQLLSSQYNPVGVTLLPDTSGFSFLDNGLIKVKKFSKRSPKIIEIYEPIYAIASVQWIDACTCFFYAKQGNRYGIYQADLDGQLSVIIKNSSYDYLYPQKIDNDLFFIERDLAGNYAVQTIAYPCIKDSVKSLDEALNCVQDAIGSCDNQLTMVQRFKERIIVSFSMIDKQKGFVVEHSPVMNLSDAVITFRFHTISRDYKNIWNTKELFSFSLPTYLFFDKERMLRDALSAVFPRLTSDGIYFISSRVGDNNMSLYHYSEYSGEIIICKDYHFLPTPKDILSYVIRGNYKHTLIPISVKGELLSGYAWE